MQETWLVIGNKDSDNSVRALSALARAMQERGACASVVLGYLAPLLGEGCCSLASFCHGQALSVSTLSPLSRTRRCRLCTACYWRLEHGSQAV